MIHKCSWEWGVKIGERSPEETSEEGGAGGATGTQEQRLPCCPWWGRMSSCSPQKYRVKEWSTCSLWRTPRQSRQMCLQEVVTLWRPHTGAIFLGVPVALQRGPHTGINLLTGLVTPWGIQDSRRNSPCGEYSYWGSLWRTLSTLEWAVWGERERETMCDKLPTIPIPCAPALPGQRRWRNREWSWVW